MQMVPCVWMCLLFKELWDLYVAIELVDIHTGNASYMMTSRIYNIAVHCSSRHTINHTNSTGKLTNCCYNAEIRNLLVRTLDVDAPVKEANRLHLHEVFQVTEPNLSNRNHNIIRSRH